MHLAAGAWRRVVGALHGKRTELKLNGKFYSTTSAQQMLFAAKSSSIKYNRENCTGGDWDVLQDVWLHQKYKMKDIAIGENVGGLI